MSSPHSCPPPPLRHPVTEGRPELITMPWGMWATLISRCVESEPWDAEINDFDSTGANTPLVAGDDKAVHKVVDVHEHMQLKLTGWFSTLKVAPGVAGEVEVDIQFSDDDGATWDSIFSTLPIFEEDDLTISGDVFARTHFPRLGRFRYDLVTVDGVAADLGFWLIGEEIPE